MPDDRRGEQAIPFMQPAAMARICRELARAYRRDEAAGRPKVALYATNRDGASRITCGQAAEDMERQAVAWDRRAETCACVRGGGCRDARCPYDEAAP